MFRGNHQTRVDEKFRLKLPAEFKRLVDELYGPLFYITSQDGKRSQDPTRTGSPAEEAEPRSVPPDGC